MLELTLHHETTADLGSTWRAWTDPETLKSWFWPERLAPVTTLDVRSGGAWRVESPVAEIAVGGEYTSVDPQRRLAFTWQWDGEHEVTDAAVEFATIDAGTRVTVVHGGFATEEDRERHIEGWTHCLSRMPE